MLLLYLLVLLAELELLVHLLVTKYLLLLVLRVPIRGLNKWIHKIDTSFMMLLELLLEALCVVEPALLFLKDLLG